MALDPVGGSIVHSCRDWWVGVLAPRRFAAERMFYGTFHMMPVAPRETHRRIDDQSWKESLAMTRSVIFFNLKPGQRQQFLDAFVRAGVLETSSFQAGYLGGRLMASTSEPDTAIVIADWESPAAYQGWLDNPAREDTSGALELFWTQEPEGQSFTLVHEVEPHTPVPGTDG